MRRAYLLAAVMAVSACANRSPYITERAPQKPHVTIRGPVTVMGKLAAPTEVLFRVAVKHAECFGLVIFWGDGESSGWATCDETSWSKPHKYKGGGTYTVVVVLTQDGKQVGLAEHRLTIL